MSASTDSAGVRIFCDGDLGAAHVQAHRALDRGQLAGGALRLERWLARHDGGSGPRWVHLQWHMMLFELQLGHAASARRRFDAHVLPAVELGQAPVDGPAGLWWLELLGPPDQELQWEPLRRWALRALERERHPHLALHHLLSLCGAGDVDALDDWLARSRPRVYGGAGPTLITAGGALRALAAGECALARAGFDRCLPQLQRLVGSRAQNSLLLAMRRAADGCSHEPAGPDAGSDAGAALAA